MNKITIICNNQEDAKQIFDKLRYKTEIEMFDGDYYIRKTLFDVIGIDEENLTIALDKGRQEFVQLKLF